MPILKLSNQEKMKENVLGAHQNHQSYFFLSDSVAAAADR